MRSSLGLLAAAALALFLSSTTLSFAKTNKTKRAPTTVMAAMGFQAPQQMDRACRSAFKTCKAQCASSEGGCVMACETDCSVCALELHNELNSKECE